VGEIYDEYDVIANKEIMPLQNGSYRVRCSANLAKVFDYFGIDEDITEVNTVNGWVSMMLDHLPKRDDKFETQIDRKKLKVRVTKADARKAIEINLVCEDVAEEYESERTEDK
ncbi:MAG: HlyC/CorC family transporter, partial [Clostridiales bacterium]|nr:HlyC/CorC family transporter [Clostridiales bacterium]